MRLKRILAGVLAVVLLGVAWWAVSSTASAPRLSPSPPPLSSRDGDAVVPEAVPPVEVADAGLRLTATLMGAHPFIGEARVGAAFVSDEDRGWWEEEGRRRFARTGPSRLEELANVREWVKAPVIASEQGGRVGPVEVPSAPRYLLAAFEPDGTIWWADHMPATQPVTGTVDLGVLREQRPTGVRVRLEGARDVQGTFSVRLQRVVEPAEVEQASALLSVLAMAAPELMHAVQNDDFIPLVTDGETRLAPLPPDRSLRLWLRAPSGKRGLPVEVPLREGSVEPVSLDVAKVFPEGVGGSVTLRGRVLLGSGARPLGPAVLIRDDGEQVRVDADGRFTMQGVPTWKQTAFSVRREQEEEARRPVAPPFWDFGFSPAVAMQGTVDVEWRVPAYQWLVLRMDGFTRAQLKERSLPLYPVYLLERRDERGGWSEVTTQEFIPEGDSVAVSLTEPGTYRIQVASSPYASRPSSVARMGEGDGDVEVSLSPEGTSGASCEVHVTRQGLPVSGARVTASGRARSMPPVHGETDTAGRWRLGPVRSELLLLWVQGAEGESWEGDGAEACRRSGVVEVAL
ncbi:carboxypeptidase regulatory-like domain-containing protein [Corallococcus silvisoli]|uniref:carboxypeptidase regulatory-like domain-containing protein n=1 Tax=Corallococcus silvisoli TaxID=2697031 RepID=UPI0013771E86|nr:carboxypeptidase regulatory-like domain-containing protein [Corallococcus silvisoli]NBD10079.1 carboxypeptidase regulatory-like domain-containing protein [Corallococcus silvisoli]